MILPEGESARLVGTQISGPIDSNGTANELREGSIAGYEGSLYRESMRRDEEIQTTGSETALTICGAQITVSSSGIGCPRKDIQAGEDKLNFAGQSMRLGLESHTIANLCFRNDGDGEAVSGTHSVDVRLESC